MIKDTLFPAGAEDDSRDLRNLGAKKKEELQALAVRTGAEVPPEATCERVHSNIRKAVMHRCRFRYLRLCEIISEAADPRVNETTCQQTIGKPLAAGVRSSRRRRWGAH